MLNFMLACVTDPVTENGAEATFQAPAVLAATDPKIWGAAPVPYAANVIGLPAVPLCPGVRVSRQRLPRLNPTDCPAVSVVELTLAMVFQGLAKVPGLESRPFTESTWYVKVPPVVRTPGDVEATDDGAPADIDVGWGLIREMPVRPGQ